MRHSRNNAGIFPSPAILESYEEISPGMVEKLVEMVRNEQKQRHTMEEKCMRSVMQATRFGQLLTALVAIAVIYATILVAGTYGIAFSAIICITGFSFLTLSGMLAARNKVRPRGASHRPGFHDNKHRNPGKR